MMMAAKHQCSSLRGRVYLSKVMAGFLKRGNVAPERHVRYCRALDYRRIQASFQLEPTPGSNWLEPAFHCLQKPLYGNGLHA